jgi:ComF family protein
MLREIWLGLLELLAPPTCAACAVPLAEPDPPFCPACGPLVEPCAWRGEQRDQAAYLYGGPLIEAVERLKYRGETERAPALARLLVPWAERWRGHVDRVCAVPMHRARLVARGYNQSALLAWPVARALGVRFDPWLLRRTRRGPPQVGSPPAARRRQLRGVFGAAPRARGLGVLVIDDVLTTGATLAEARRALTDAGAREVYGLALAGAQGRGAPSAPCPDGGTSAL